MKYLPWLLVGMLLGYGWFAEERHAKRIVELEAQAAQVDTVYLTDTLWLTKVRYETDTILATKTDTVMHIDTVRILIAGERKACDAVIQTCEQRVAARDRVNKELKKAPSVASHLPWVLGGIAIWEIFK